MDTSQTEALAHPNRYLIQWIFPTFAQGLSGISKEIVCIVSSAALLAVIPLVFKAATALWQHEFNTTQFLSMEIMYFYLGALSVIVCVRVWTLLLERLSAPYDWLISPIPIALFLSVSGFYYITWITSKHANSMAQTGINLIYYAPQLALVSMEGAR